jgi:pimeloyl-ACP methyl ester carboxylesterase
LRRINHLLPWRIVVIVACACLAWPNHSFGRSNTHVSRAARLYVLLGFANMSPGLGEFAAKIRHRGISTTIGSYTEWQALAQEAIQQYKSGRLRSIMIIGHSLGADAGTNMAAALGRAGVPVRLLVTLASVGAPKASSNVRRSVNIRPKNGEDHFSVIAAHERDLIGYVLGSK